MTLKEINHHEKTGKIITASVLSAITCLSCGAMSTTAFAAEADNTAAVSQQQEMPILKQGVWQAVGINGKSDYIEINNNVQTMKLSSSENNIGVTAVFEYTPSTGTYTVHPGAYSNVETWQLTSNSGEMATLTKSNGQSFSLFYMGYGHVKDFYSLNQLTQMSKNYFAWYYGSANDACFVANLKNDGSGEAVVTVYGRDTMHQVIVDVYTINVRTGVGIDSNLHVIDFANFA